MKLLVVGANGMVGNALFKFFRRNNSFEVHALTREDCDLESRQQTIKFVKENSPEIVIDAAAKTGGIGASIRYPVDFLIKNTRIQNNLFEACNLSNVSKLVFLGSSCMYPRETLQPMREDQILTGMLEPTNYAYSIAKIAGTKLISAYNQQFSRHWFSIIPTNLYGPRDDFDFDNSHVIPSLIRKFDEAKRERKPEVLLWGSGGPRREFMYISDFVNAVNNILNLNHSHELINVGTGHDYTILELAETVKNIVGYDGEIKWDLGKPDGAPRKLLNIDILKSTGWVEKFDLRTGIELTYDWYLGNIGSALNRHKR